MSPRTRWRDFRTGLLSQWRHFDVEISPPTAKHRTLIITYLILTPILAVKFERLLRTSALCPMAMSRLSPWLVLVYVWRWKGRGKKLMKGQLFESIQVSKWEVHDNSWRNFDAIRCSWSTRNKTETWETFASIISRYRNYPQKSIWSSIFVQSFFACRWEPSRSFQTAPNTIAKLPTQPFILLRCLIS